uniref:Uncharacterized protein n=1 Tax=Medicago truncatula TaxID=3880 RepID=A2Q2J6_MEDTR|nr:hypothetical protein MtrDRAFT_AC150891g57v2 [Medicago truncatula]
MRKKKPRNVKRIKEIGWDLGNNGNYHASEIEKQELCANHSPPLHVLFSPR